MILEKAQRGICRARQRERFGGIWLSNGRRLLPANHTNLGEVFGGVPPSHPPLQKGCALTEGLCAVELPLEEQRMELEMTDRKGYALYWELFPRNIKMTVDCD